MNAENERLEKELAISAAQIRKLEPAASKCCTLSSYLKLLAESSSAYVGLLSMCAEDHADELAKARDGYLETKAVHAQIAHMEKPVMQLPNGRRNTPPWSRRERRSWS